MELDELLEAYAGSVEVLRPGDNPVVVVNLDDFDSIMRSADELKSQLAAANTAREKLQAFKDWVHSYLDGKDIPYHPPGTHGAEGCRIGDRMDYVFAAKEKAERERDEGLGVVQTLRVRLDDTDARAERMMRMRDEERADRDRLAGEVEKVRAEARALLTAVTFKGAPEDFNGVPCYEARVPVGFVEGMRAALSQPAQKEPSRARKAVNDE